MEIHFYEYIHNVPAYKPVYHDWWTTKYTIENEYKEIHTTQMCMLSTTLLHNGYRIFVHQHDGIVYEITLQNKDNDGNRSVRPAQNMYAMWANNVFREAKK